MLPTPLPPSKLLQSMNSQAISVLCTYPRISSDLQTSHNNELLFFHTTHKPSHPLTTQIGSQSVIILGAFCQWISHTKLEQNYPQSKARTKNANVSNNQV